MPFWLLKLLLILVKRDVHAFCPMQFHWVACLLEMCVFHYKQNEDNLKAFLETSELQCCANSVMNVDVVSLLMEASMTTKLRCLPTCLYIARMDHFWESLAHRGHPVSRPFLSCPWMGIREVLRSRLLSSPLAGPEISLPLTRKGRLNGRFWWNGLVAQSSPSTIQKHFLFF
jgi:hypothetical protein